MSEIRVDENGIETRTTVVGDDNIVEHRHGEYDYFHPANRLHKGEQGEIINLPFGHLLADGKVVEEKILEKSEKRIGGVMRYIEKKTLANRGAIDPEPDEDVEGILLVAEKAIFGWDSGHIRYGHDSNSLSPAIYNGKRAWLLQSVWQPASGYCASGTTESILDFESGAKILIEQGVFSFPIKP